MATEHATEPGTYRIVRPGERTAVVELIGEHDLHTMQKVSPVIDSLVVGNDVLVVDLSRTEFMDSTVLKELVRAKHALEQHQGRLVLSGVVEPVVRRSLEVSGMINYFDTALTWDTAIHDGSSPHLDT
jgi:anti-sigma B factor antagonist